MNYATLVNTQSTAGSIANWIADSYVQASAANIIEEAESWIYRRLRHWSMSTSVSGTLTIGQAYLAIPADCLEPSLLTIFGIYAAEIEQKPKEEVVRNYGYDGAGARIQQQPLIYWFDQTNFNFDNPPDKAYPYTLYYFQQPVALATSGTNFLTSRYPRLLRCCIMASACEFKKDIGQGQMGRDYWLQLAEQEIQVAQMESDRSIRAIHAGAMII